MAMFHVPCLHVPVHVPVRVPVRVHVYVHVRVHVRVHVHVHVACACACAWCVCLQVERLKEEQIYKVADAGPAAEIQAALTDAQEDLNAKSEEAKQLRSKIGRLETAIRELM